ncbi:hypothetical protein [Streptomyces hirsutus]|uniref:hypothetical protein n=1 Tax=Streptomyces hirsutus TaxID=35620 RepID=UPI003682EEF9
MSDGEQDFGAWRTEQHRRAQAYAFSAAEQAQAQYERAVEYEDKARGYADNPHLNGWMADARRLAQVHGVRSTEALKLAEMWASVARALADGELPVTNVLEVRGSVDQADFVDTYADPNIVGRVHFG